jgi:hypothetical protein
MAEVPDSRRSPKPGRAIRSGLAGFRRGWIADTLVLLATIALTCTLFLPVAFVAMAATVNTDGLCICSATGAEYPSGPGPASGGRHCPLCGSLGSPISGPVPDGPPPPQSPPIFAPVRMAIPTGQSVHAPGVRTRPSLPRAPPRV